MKGFRIVCVGKIKEAYFNDGIDYYVKDIRKSMPMEVVECPDEPTPDRASEAQEAEIRRIEGSRILQKIHEDDYVVALCIDGKHYDTTKWISRTKRQMAETRGYYTFVIGGSLGLSEEVVRRANEKLSFSSMTFPHQMMRMILCEQIARIFL
ncbi:MAG: 23S rRNA (pseudouridine(1915)-N(3))-methyltransferase RlmH [Eubacteriales bacterium]|nr:23S rRNA (pseudouridine(1915)-N(3))-methyltransferase RlmH [Eubacteriales bacterium]